MSSKTSFIAHDPDSGLTTATGPGGFAQIYCGARAAAALAEALGIDFKVQRTIIGGEMPGYDWGRHGVQWTGVPGHPIERVDGQELGRPFFEDDMLAAIHVAKNSMYHYVVYFTVDPDDCDGQASGWWVTVFETHGAAIRAALDAEYPAFWFDGRSDTPIRQQNGGYSA